MTVNNVIVALFDAQLDCQCTTSPTQYRPSLALLLDKKLRLPIVTKYILITPKEQLKAAFRLKPLLEEGLRNMNRAKVKGNDNQNTLLSEIEVQISEIRFDNIWDIKSCSNNLDSILCADKTVESIIDADTKQITSKPKVIISLLGSTAAARTALYLTMKRLERDCGRFQLWVAKYYDVDNAAHSVQLWAGADISSVPNGLLRLGVGTKHTAYAAALDRLECVIQTFREAKILISGPTGAGKSELGRLVIAYLQVLHGNINVDNCIVQNIAAIAPNLIESELFGHEKGAFTGADKRHTGIFERANNGILFLDEIGELPLHLQVKLLTILDGNPFTRVGGTKSISSRFLLICGTNKDLRQECTAGRFRKDLFERLNTWQIEVPALKDRPEDIERALQREFGEWKSTHNTEAHFAKGARRTFLDIAKQCEWEGNFREFHATFLHLALFAGKGGISEQAIEEEFNRKTSREEDGIPLSGATPSADKPDSSNSAYDLAEMARLACALDACRKCKTATEAGEVLFAARAESARNKHTGFNGASSLQRIFTPFGLKVHFKNGKFSVSSMTLPSSES